MNKISNYLIGILPIISILLISWTMPLSTGYYAMNTFLERLFYIVGLYGISIWIIIPISFLACLIAIIPFKKRSYKKRIVRICKWIFIFINIILVIVNGGLTFSKFILKKDPFPVTKYGSLKATNKDLSIIKEGRFNTSYGKIYRKGNDHKVIYTNGDTAQYKITWMDNGEHLLVKMNQEHSFNDSLKIMVTFINKDYYECYYKLGKLAHYDKIEFEK